MSAWIFSIAKENQYFEKTNRLTFGILKNIEQFIKGYEVEECPLILWEKAVLNGYRVFRSLKSKEGGTVICDKVKRTIEYREG